MRTVKKKDYNVDKSVSPEPHRGWGNAIILNNHSYQSSDEY